MNKRFLLMHFFMLLSLAQICCASEQTEEARLIRLFSYAR